MITRADPTPRQQRDAMGRAIRSLRERSGPAGSKLSTLAAAANIGRTRQTWEKYENAKGDAILRQDVQAEVARALGLSREDLLAEYERQLNPGAVASRYASMVDRGPGPSVELPPATTRRLILQDDHLRPWAHSGTVIVYDTEQWPTPDHGCVLELADGQRMVKIFLRAEADAFHVAELAPERREFTVPREGAAAYRVVARLG